MHAFPALASLLCSTQAALAPAQDEHEDELLVTSRFTDEVLRYDLASGAFLGAFAKGAPPDNPVGLTFGPRGELFVASAETDQVLRYDGETGALQDATTARVARRSATS